MAPAQHAPPFKEHDGLFQLPSLFHLSASDAPHNLEKDSQILSHGGPDLTQSG